MTDKRRTYNEELGRFGMGKREKLRGGATETDHLKVMREVRGTEK